MSDEARTEGKQRLARALALFDEGDAEAALAKAPRPGNSPGSPARFSTTSDSCSSRSGGVGGGGRSPDRGAGALA